MFRAEVLTTITDYIELNKASVDMHGMLWEAFKVVVRGVYIAKGAGLLRYIRSLWKAHYIP